MSTTKDSQAALSWRVGEFESSSMPSTTVLMLAESAADAARMEAHSSFVRWVSKPSHEVEREVLTLHTEMAGLRLALNQANMRVASAIALSNHAQDRLATQQHADPSSLKRFLEYLTDHCIGQTVTEEAMEEWMADLLDATPRNEPANPPKSKGLFASAQTGQRAGVAEGWKAMPMKLTVEMRKAGARAAREYMERTGNNNLDVIYAAMLGAAPTPAVQQQAEPVGDEREAAESAYNSPEFNYERGPIGSRDWRFYSAGWRARATRAAQQQAEPPSFVVPAPGEDGLVPLPERMPASVLKHGTLGELYDRLSVHKFAVGYALVCLAAKRAVVQAEPVGEECACERCGQPSSEHVGTHWCDNQSFQVEESSSLNVHVDSLDGQLEYLIGRIKTVPSDDMAALVVANIRDRIAQIRSIAAQFSKLAGAAKWWKLVPVEPTDEMVRAGNDLRNTRYATPARHIYAAMLAAAPSQQEGQSND
ncbi:hypothetical protein [Ralstonia sp. ASV6]|uniref:hypothetical protein n=1 Tax=Ralstonia sp. ASV6 TaxID=2795124 RepID=UPI0018EAFB6A|nr:hypothetical protein [Ralstonia sp. ASV6]